MECHKTFLHSENNPRNSEGAFVVLNDGTLLFAYTRYCGNDWDDHCPADIYAVKSADDGKTWSEPFLMLKHRNANIMSVSLLRLQDGRIAMIYCEKSYIGDTTYIDCRPWIMFSEDECVSWSEPIDVSSGTPVRYLVVNNDRIIQLKNGRLILPASCHPYKADGHVNVGFTIYFLSDDGGATWRQSLDTCFPVFPSALGLMEPGVIELNDGRIMGWFRTGQGCHYKSFSSDGGEQWTQIVPAPEFRAPSSPLSMKRCPETGYLVAIWNDYHPSRSVKFVPGVMGRSPLVLAVSKDEGRTWQDHMVLEDSPDHGFAYTAMLFHKGRLFLSYCCGGTEGMLRDCCIKSLVLPFE